MSDLIVAEFDTQFAAAAALDKLISHGLRRDSAVVRSSESVGGSSASSSAPTTVVSRVSHHAVPRNEIRAPADMRAPSRVGQATLTVELARAISLEDAMQVMKATGARDVHVVVNQKLDAEDPQLQPEVEYGSPLDVDRANAASRPTR
jgi:hypothetical protein